MFIAIGAVHLLDALHGLAYIQENLPAFYLFLVGKPLEISVIIVATIFIVVGAAELRRRGRQHGHEDGGSGDLPAPLHNAVDTSGVNAQVRVAQGFRDNTGTIRVGDETHNYYQAPSVVSHEPVLQVEPETGMVMCANGVPGDFDLNVVSTGLPDVTHVRIFLDLVFAQQMPNEITVRKVGPIFTVPNQIIDRLSKNIPHPVPIRFANLVPIVQEVSGRSLSRGIPSIQGVRILLEFRRIEDGKDFSSIHAYGMDPSGMALMAPIEETAFPGILRFTEVMPYLQTKQNWGSVPRIISGGPGGLTSRYE
ncbi:MAG: hypothetical protein ACLQU1_08375 [Bryobacteraceae bacterium]